MSGGFVAAITQTTSGLFTTNNLQAVFMVGFGWQGALTGVAGSSTRVKLSDELQQTRLNATEGIEIALKAKDIKITQLTDALRKISEEKMKGAVS
jgi:carbon monoxide dehydrogenase subunit G